jgi:hypothetical protein
VRGVFLGVALLAVGLVAGVIVGPCLLPEAPDPGEGRVVVRETTRVETPRVEVSEPGRSADSPVEPDPTPPVGDPPPRVNVARMFRSILSVTKVHPPAASSQMAAVILERFATERGIKGGPGWLLSDEAAAREVLEGVLTAAGLEIDDGQRAALAALAAGTAPLFRAAAKHEGNETERMALRREAEARLENGLADVLLTNQMSDLDVALRGGTLIGILPGGQERDTLSSTGVTEEKASTMVLANLRKRIGLTDDAHPAVRSAVDDYVRNVAALNETLEARWGRGFVEAVCSGPTPHTEAGREARTEAGYARRELEARATLWRLQADLERTVGPLLTEEQRERLRIARPTALSFLTAGD